MIKSTLTIKQKVYNNLLIIAVIIVVFFVVVLVQLVSFFRSMTDDFGEQISHQIIGTLENTFLNLEHVAIAMSSREEVQELLREQDVLAYHEKTQTVRDHLDSLYQQSGVVDDILLYDTDGRYCRLRGELGNTAADRIAHLVEPNIAPQHIALTLEQENYIGYVTSVIDGGDINGFFVFLLRESNLQALINDYDTTNSLDICLVADGSIITSNNTEIIGTAVEDMDNMGLLYSDATVRQIGSTPFEMAVFYDTYMSGGLVGGYMVAAVVTLILLLSLLIWFYRIFKQQFFDPMLLIIDSTKQDDDKIALTGQPDFDLLVQRVNTTTEKLKSSHRNVFDMRNRIQTAEIERQKAIIVSLKKQINAHFTVNTLNVIKRLHELGENDKAGEMSDGLAFILRYANGAEDSISCFDELMVLEKYVDIMHMRFPDRFTSNFDVDEELYDLYLPRMLLQPIIENSITHGMPSTGDGQLSVEAYLNGDRLIFNVIDNGRGLTPERLWEIREKIRTAHLYPIDDDGIEHIALQNIQKRVVSFFGTAFGLDVSSTYGRGTQVTLTLPARRQGGIYIFGE